MGIQNVAAIFCIPLIPPLLGYKIWQPHAVSPKRSKGGYRIWQAYIIWRYTGHITTGSWKGRGNQYIEFARVLYCKLPTNGKQLPAFPHKALTGIEPRPQRLEARVLPLCHRGPRTGCKRGFNWVRDWGRTVLR